MSKNQEYDYIVGKLPRKDKSGKDTTKDRIGKGGRHRDDGTYSSVVYDIEIIDEYPEKRVSRPPLYPANEQRPVRYEDLPLGGQILVDVADAVVPQVFDFLTAKALDSFDQWLNRRRQRKQSEKNQLKKDSSKGRTITKAERLMKEKEQQEKAIKTTIVLPDVDTAYEQFSINMTSTEAQKELLDAFVLYLISAKKMWRLSHAKITDASGEISSGKELIEKLTDQPIIQNINSLLENNYNLLDDWQEMALSDILGRELVFEEKFIPIDDDDLRKRIYELPE